MRSFTEERKMRDYKVGELVVLTLDSPGSVGITDGLKRHQGKVFRIKKAVGLKVSRNGWYESYYELAGCVSKYGKPYAITGDWLKPIRDTKR